VSGKKFMSNKKTFIVDVGDIGITYALLWKAHGRLPICDKCTFLLALMAKTLLSRNLPKVCVFQKRWVTLGANFKWKGCHLPTAVGVRILE